MKRMTLFALLSLGATTAVAAIPGAIPGYVTSSAGDVVRTGSGQCVHTGSWTPAMAIPRCEPALARANQPQPIARVPVVVAPEPKPVAVVPQPEVVAVAKPQVQRITLSSDVLFPFDSAKLRDSATEKLQAVASQIKGADVDKAVVVGWADPIGPEPYNEQLSGARAQSVKEFLAANGVDATIESEGRGETRQFTGGECQGKSGNELISCLEPNRRVDIEIAASRTQ